MRKLITSRSDTGELEVRDAESRDLLNVSNPRSREFGDFLTWRSFHNEPPLQNPDVPPRQYFFTDQESFVEHMKKWSARLYATMESTSSMQRQSIQFSESGAVEGVSFRRICKASCVLPDNSRFSVRQPDVYGFFCVESDTWVSEELYALLQSQLGDDSSPARRISSVPISRCFVYLDVSDYSQMHVGHQVLVTSTINAVYDDPILWPRPTQDWRSSYENRICIGDGYIFVFRDSLAATCVAAYLASMLETLVAKRGLQVDFHFRIGIHSGPVFTFWDPGRDDWNYIGEGINGGQRVLAAIGKDVDDV